MLYDLLCCNALFQVKLKGMNSYETRLNELKQMTDQLDNKDLINEIETLAQKWSETYALISKYSVHFFLIFVHFYKATLVFSFRNFQPYKIQF